MRIRDYIFRCFAMLIVWLAIVVMVMESGLFIPADIFEMVLGISVVCGGVMATIVVWCGPEIVRYLMAPKPLPPPAERDASWETPAD